jgi:hypothetical protein
LSPTSHVIAAAIGKKLGIGINAEAAGIGIPASDISVPYLNIPGPEWVPLFWYRIGSGIGILCPVPDWPDAGQSGISAFTKTVYWRKKVNGTSVHGFMVLNLLYDDKTHMEMPECQEKVCSASTFLPVPVVSCVSPESVFRYQGQSGNLKILFTVVLGECASFWFLDSQIAQGLNQRLPKLCELFKHVHGEKLMHGNQNFEIKSSAYSDCRVVTLLRPRRVKVFDFSWILACRFILLTLCEICAFFQTPESEIM